MYCLVFVSLISKWPKGCFLTFLNISGMCIQWCLQLILVRYWSLWCPSACFQRIQDIDLDSPSTDAWIQNSLPYYVYHLFSFPPNFKTKGVPGLPGYTGKMFTPVNKTFIKDLYNAWPLSMWTFNSWRCAKGKDVKL